MKSTRLTLISLLLILLIGRNVMGQGPSPLPQVKAEAALIEGSLLFDRSLFAEAALELETAVRQFAKAKQPSHQLEALFLLESCYDMTFENDKRWRVLDQLQSVAAETYRGSHPATGSDSLPTSHPDFHRALVCRADHLFDLGKSDSARKFLEPLIPRFEHSNDYKSLSSAYLLLGRCQQKRLDQNGARDFYEKALQISQQYLPGDYEQQVFILGRLGYFYARLGHWQPSVAYSQQRMDLLQNLPEKSARDSLEIGKCHLAFTEAYSVTGDPDLALEHAEKALRIFRKVSISHPRFIGDALALSAARGVRNKEKTEEQKWTLQRGLEADEYLSTPTDKYMALSTYHNNILLIRPYQMDEAWNLKKVQECYALSARWGIDPQLASLKASVMDIAAGDLDSAISHAKTSLVQYKQEYGLEDCSQVSQGYSHYILGIAFLKAASFDSAAWYLHLALQDYSFNFRDDNLEKSPPAEGVFVGPHIIDAMYYKGLALMGMAEFAQDTQYWKMAFEVHLRGMEMANAWRQTYIDKRARLDLSANVIRMCEGVVKSGLRLYEQTGDTLYFNRAFWASEMTKSQLLLESWTRSHTLRSSGIPEAVLLKEDSLKKELVFYEGALIEYRISEDAKDQKLEDRLDEKISGIKGQLRAWEAEIRKQFPKALEQSERAHFPTPDEIRQDLLAPGEALVEYFLGQEELYFFVLSRERAEAIRMSLPEGLDSTLQSYLKSIGDVRYVLDSVPQGYAHFTSSAFQLYRWLLHPLFSDGSLPNKLILVPDGLLTQMPFEPLLTSAPRKELDYIGLPYLLHKTRVHYCYSAAFLWGSKRRKRTGTAARCLAVAPGGSSGPNRSGGEISSAGELPFLRNDSATLEGTQKELQMIADLGIEGYFLQGDSASERRFKELAPLFQVVHLATHGLADPNTPGRSSLRFSQTPDDSTEDNRLFAYELDGLPLIADLVVLSACESGIGKYLTGEGTMSLGRGFMANGVGSLVMTLWRVEDQTSAQLMQSFYMGLADGLQVDDALYEAKKKALDQGDSRTAHPYFWAGYVSNGNAAPVSFRFENKDNSQFWWMIFLLLPALLIWNYLRKRKHRRPA